MSFNFIQVENLSSNVHCSLLSRNSQILYEYCNGLGELLPNHKIKRNICKFPNIIKEVYGEYFRSRDEKVPVICILPQRSTNIKRQRCAALKSNTRTYSRLFHNIWLNHFYQSHLFIKAIEYPKVNRNIPKAINFSGQFENYVVHHFSTKLNYV